MTAGTLISLRNWSTESIAVVPHDNRPEPRHHNKVNSIHPLRGLLIVCQKLVRVGGPGNREQRQNRDDGQCLHASMIGSDCGQKRQSLAHFLDQAGKLSWPRRILRKMAYSITSSARSRNDSGMARPSALAVWRLTTRSNLTGACTGKSAGFSPRRMRSI
jgi:hypothetical protein